MIAAAILFAATAAASVKTAHVEVGEPVSITVRVTARPAAMVTIQPPPPHLPDYDVPVTQSRLVQTDATGIATYSFEIVPFNDHELDIPEIHVDVAGSGAALTNPLVLKPFNPLGEKAKDQKPADIRDIRAFPVRLPLWLLAVLGTGIAALMWALFRPKAPPKEAARAPRAKVAPRARTLADAIDEVRAIAANPPRDLEGIRHAHFVVAEAVRRYVEERWEVPASKQTTEEFLASVAARSIPRIHRSGNDIGLGGPRLGMGMEMLPAVLEACDRVKWAGDAVGPDDTLQLARTALEFFAASRPATRGLGGPEAGRGDIGPDSITAPIQRGPGAR